MSSSQPIAVVGRAGLFPGATDLAGFWENILAGRDAARSVPEGRWAIGRDRVRPERPPQPDGIYSERACYLDDFDLGVASELLDLPEDVGALDPLVQLVLRVGAEAWADAKTEEVDRSRAGLILANIALPTDASSAMTREVLGRSLEEDALGPKASCATDSGLGSDPRNRYVTGLPAALLAQGLGLGAGNWTLDAACASSLYALHLACEELRAGRADLMLAGGASRPECLYTNLGFSQLTALSSRGVCSPFDERGDGLVVGEGAGIFVLKRLDDALAQGDRIYGLIHGVGLSNDVGGSLLAPDSEGQQRAMRQAYERAGWSPDCVGLVECHGTGTPKGDGVELRSLGSVFGSEAQGVVVGSVKSNVGHLLTGAGAAGFMKILLALEHRTLPPSANWTRETAHPELVAGPFRVLDAPQDWASEAPRRAAVSGFGFGGINAHLLVEEWTGQEPEGDEHSAQLETPQPLAIVGMGAHYAGLRSLADFGRAALRGEAAIVPRPEGRWKGVENSDWLRRLAPWTQELGGGWVNQVDVPVGRYRIPPNEIPGILPQQLLALEVAAAAFEDAGFALGDEAALPRAGVVVGMGLDLETTSWNLGWVAEQLAESWLELHAEDTDPSAASDWTRELRAVLGHGLDATRTVGALGGIIASRIARELRFGGPSFALSAEDGSGLRGLEVASRLLQRGEVDLMLVGAVDLAGDVRAVLAQDRIEPWSRSGVARPMDHRADGPVVGEGAGAVLLKRLSDAERDGDRIYAVVDGCGAGADWSTALTRAQADAGSDRSELGLVELAASGSPERDSTELRALADFLAADPGPTALSAIRGLIGDAGAAGGLASLIKTALALYHRRLPALPNFERPAQGLVPDGAGFHVPIAPQYWHQDQASGPRRAGVSDRSLFGNYLHVRLSEWLVRDASSESSVLDSRDLPVGPRGYGLFAYDSDEVPMLRQLATEFAQAGVEELAARWFRRRGGRGSCALVAQSTEELLRRAELPQLNSCDLDGPVAWVFPGSGSHYVGMGRSLGEAFPGVQRQIDESTTRLASQLAVSTTAPWRLDWTGDWESDAQARLESETRRVIFGQVAHGAAVGKTLAWFGLKPDAVIGYSLGESAGLFASGAWSARDTMFERMLASELFEHQLVGACTVAAQAYGTDRPDWVAAVVRAPVEEVRTELKGSLRLLIVNAPGECVVGGRRRDVELLAGRLDCGDPILLEGVPTVHSELVDPVAEDYRKLHILPTEALEGVRFYSGNWTRAYELESDESAAASIVANATRGLDYQRTIEQAWADGIRIFIEGGPGTSCTRMIGAILGDRPHLALSVCQAGVDGGLAMLRGLAKLIRAGVEVDLSPLYGEDSGVWMRASRENRPLVSVVAGGERPKPRSIGMLPSSSKPKDFSETSSETRTLDSITPAVPPSASKTRQQNGLEPRPAVPAAPGAQTAGASGGANEVHVSALAEGEGSVDLGGALITEQMRIGEATARAHGLFLDTNEGYRKLALDLHTSLTQLAALAGAVPTLSVPAAPPHRPLSEPSSAARQRPTLTERIAAASPVMLPAEPFALDRDKCMDIAIGAIGEVLGPMFAPADDYPTRVRLPDEPLMLVDRILSIEGQPGQMGSGRVVTEHDVLPDNWYLDGGRCPVCISVEAGQADLFLSGYLGIDLQTQGLRVYRLLDAEVCFHRDLPRVGETIRYDIRIDKFIRQGSTWLFFFHFEGFIGDEHLISMRNGCAGFFSAEQLEAGKGIVSADPDQAPPRRPGTTEFRDLVSFGQGSLCEPELAALRQGDLGSAFGSAFAGRRLHPALCLPGGRMELIHRVPLLDPKGGAYGLGRIEAEADVDPEGWYLTCHFVDDMVMPGTLMYEGCLHTLRVFLLRLGWVVEPDQRDLHYAPIPGQASGLRCRGQVLQSSKKITYRIDIKELGYDPEPYVLADAVMFVDEKKAVRFTNVSYRLHGLDEANIAAGWSSAAVDGSLAGSIAGPSPVLTAPGPSTRTYGPEQILAYAIGRPSEGFGAPYRVFDEERVIARLPGPPFLFVDRVTHVVEEPFVLARTDWVHSEWDVDPEAWYFAGGASRTMPFCIFLEAALQPCGWLAAYLGSALRSDGQLHFRNLEGGATLHRELDPRIGTIQSRVRLTSFSEAGGMIIQNFDLELSQDGRVIYEGWTRFGFFPTASLKAQIGIRDAGGRLYGPEGAARPAPLQRRAPLSPDDASACGVPSRERLELPPGALLMLDAIEDLRLDQGPAGLGYAQGSMTVDPSAWFFAAHFYQDPVIPGSLGLQSFIQLMKALAIERWPALVETHRFEAIAIGREHNWIYRGQVVPENDRVEVRCWVDSIEEGDEPVLVASGFLLADGKPIYEMKNFPIRLVRQ